jgi:hypothetical protein
MCCPPLFQTWPRCLTKSKRSFNYHHRGTELRGRVLDLLLIHLVVHAHGQQVNLFFTSFRIGDKFKEVFQEILDRASPHLACFICLPRFGDLGRQVGTPVLNQVLANDSASTVPVSPDGASL